MLLMAVPYFLLGFWLARYLARKQYLVPREIALIAVLGCLDCHANFCLVKAYSLTTLTSVMIILVFTVPSTMMISCVFLKVEYAPTHFVSL
mmetsp:Transcript_11028/g.12404  ORF Transcript_11028/g.12404 Transcript_11028/m.12404 type:complete len:91 (+) Transcript_11028:167-439(+)